MSSAEADSLGDLLLVSAFNCTLLQLRDPNLPLGSRSSGAFLESAAWPPHTRKLAAPQNTSEQARLTLN